MNERWRSRKLAMRLEALVFALLVLAGCKHEPGLPGAWLSSDGSLLLVIDKDNTATFVSVLGEGSCFAEAKGMVVRNTIEVEGVTITIAQSGHILVLREPSGMLNGSYRKISLSSICYVSIPDPGPASARVSGLMAGPITFAGRSRTRAIDFDVPAGTASVSLYLFGIDIGYSIGFASLETPTDPDILSIEPDLAACFNGYCAIELPKAPGFEPTAGHYRATIEGTGSMDDASINIRLAMRPGPIASPTTIHVHAFVAPTNFPSADIMSALLQSQAFFAPHGIQWVIDAVTMVDNATYSSLVADPLTTRAQAFMAMGDPNAINFFLVNDLTGIEGLFGLSSGIPGSLGVAGPWNGVLINLSLHTDFAGAMQVQALSDTMVHESSHLLGLYHTTEKDGMTFDIIADTPECPASVYDTDHDGVVLADECMTAGGDNLLFWTPSTTDNMPIVQNVLSNDQIDVISHAVIGE